MSTKASPSKPVIQSVLRKETAEHQYGASFQVVPKTATSPPKFIPNSNTPNAEQSVWQSPWKKTTTTTTTTTTRIQVSAVHNFSLLSATSWIRWMASTPFSDG